MRTTRASAFVFVLALASASALFWWLEASICDYQFWSALRRAVANVFLVYLTGLVFSGCIATVFLVARPGERRWWTLLFSPFVAEMVASYLYMKHWAWIPTDGVHGSLWMYSIPAFAIAVVVFNRAASGRWDMVSMALIALVAVLAQVYGEKLGAMLLTFAVSRPHCGDDITRSSYVPFYARWFFLQPLTVAISFGWMFRTRTTG